MSAITGYVRAAFAVGYAETAPDGVVSERARRACLAAMQEADVGAEDPAIIEATLRLGKTEGVLATLYARRRAVEAKHNERLRAFMPTVLRAVDAANLVDRIMSHGEAVNPADPLLGAADATAAGSAIARARAVLHALPPSITDRWRAITHDAFLDGQAEGAAGAQALISELGGLAVDFDLSFDAALNALKDLDSIWASAGDWLAQQIQAAGGVLGRALAGGVRDGVDRSEMISIVRRTIGDTAGTEVILDHAIQTAVSQGSLDGYNANGVEWLDWTTADDPDEECSDYEASNPWRADADDLPDMPAHINCRCSWAVADMGGADMSAVGADIGASEG